MSWHGILQTGDIDEAIGTAIGHVLDGHHVEVKRRTYRLDEDDYRRLEKGFPIAHAPIEYEVYADLPDR
jgi:hypothetical protein